jgi:TfoX/Sxy family transcriptional regulator of competence genes
MVYDETVAARIRKLLVRNSHIDERKMFGGIAYLYDGKMACGVLNKDLVVRIDPASAEKLLRTPGVRPMDFTGRPLRGFLYVSPAGYRTDAALKKWVTMTLTHAASLPKKR